MDLSVPLKKYLSLGLSVFPVKISWNEIDKKYDKKPAIAWEKYMTTLPTNEEIDVWCSMMDFNGIGMATGKLSGISVLDIDDYKEMVDTDYASPCTARTISGGTHLWYKHIDGVKNTTKVNGMAMDIRGEGGYVVLPPSAVDDKKYKWLLFDMAKLKPFPLELIIKKEDTYKPAMITLPEASMGNRNDTAIKVAGHIIANTKMQAWGTVGWSAMVKWNESKCNPPLEEFELKRTFESACTMENINHPIINGTQIDMESECYWGDEIDKKYLEEKSRYGEGVSTGYDELDEYFKFFPEHLYVLSAPTHHGKTTLALNMAARSASFGNRVLFCSLEQGLFITPRIKTILGGPIPPSLGMLKSDITLSMDYLINLFEEMEVKPELIVIDHLHFIKKDTRNGVTNSVDKMMEDLQNAAKRMFVPMLVISHLRKLNDDKPPTLDDLRDSSSLSQIPSVGILMFRKRDPVTGELPENGAIYIDKNRITGKMGKINFLQAGTGEITLTPYIKKQEISF